MKKIAACFALVMLTGCLDKPGLVECNILGVEYKFEVVDYDVYNSEAVLTLQKSKELSVPNTKISITPATSCRFIPRSADNSR